MKNALYVVLILIIFGLSYLKWQSWQNPISVEPVATSTPAPSTSSVNTLPLSTTYFTLDYPSSASSSPVVESPDSLSWTIRYMGETQRESGRTQTELFDGYAITLTIFPSVVGDDPVSTQAETDRQGTINGCGQSSVTQIKSVDIAGNKAISFSGGCVGEANHFYFMHDQMLYRIVTMAVGTPEDVFIYQQAVDKTLASLKLL
jgi:hypothetical protein